MLPSDALSVEYRRHAVERYGERVRPGCSFTATLEQLHGVVECAGQIVSEPPLWAPWDAGTSAYLVVGDDIVFPLENRTGRGVRRRDLFDPGLAASGGACGAAGAAPP